MDKSTAKVRKVASKAIRKPKAKAISYDDDKQNLIIAIGDTWMDRYVVKSILGKGSYGQVVQARDQFSSLDIAIKVIKNKPAFHQQAQTELRLLKMITSMDVDDNHNIVHYQNDFLFRGHICISFELLGPNLYEVLQKGRFKGLTMEKIQLYAVQMLNALAFIHDGECGVMHCDLKPENVLVYGPDLSDLKIIDFGSSCLDHECNHSYIQSRYYRAPEVMLGLESTHAIDMWSMGCILMEIFTGKPLFAGTNEVDQMMRIVEVCGLPTYSFVMRATTARINRYFVRDPYARMISTVASATSYQKPGQRSLQGVVSTAVEARRTVGSLDASPTQIAQFRGLVEAFLEYDPFRRLEAKDALSHPLFSQIISCLPSQRYVPSRTSTPIDTDAALFLDDSTHAGDCNPQPSTHSGDYHPSAPPSNELNTAAFRPNHDSAYSRSSQPPPAYTDFHLTPGYFTTPPSYSLFYMPPTNTHHSLMHVPRRSQSSLLVNSTVTVPPAEWPYSNMIDYATHTSQMQSNSSDSSRQGVYGIPLSSYKPISQVYSSSSQDRLRYPYPSKHNDRSFYGSRIRGSDSSSQLNDHLQTADELSAPGSSSARPLPLQIPAQNASYSNHSRAIPHLIPLQRTSYEPVNSFIPRPALQASVASAGLTYPPRQMPGLISLDEHSSQVGFRPLPYLIPLTAIGRLHSVPPPIQISSSFTPYSLYVPHSQIAYANGHYASDPTAFITPKHYKPMSGNTVPKASRVDNHSPINLATGSSYALSFLDEAHGNESTLFNFNLSALLYKRLRKALPQKSKRLLIAFALLATAHGQWPSPADFIRNIDADDDLDDGNIDEVLDVLTQMAERMEKLPRRLDCAEHALSTLIMDPVFDHPRFLRPCFRQSQPDTDVHTDVHTDDKDKGISPSILATKMSLPRAHVENITSMQHSDCNGCVKARRLSSAHLDQVPSSDCSFTSANDATHVVGFNSVEARSQQYEQNKFTPRQCVNPYGMDDSRNGGESYNSQDPPSIDEQYDEAQPPHRIGETINKGPLMNQHQSQSTDISSPCLPKIIIQASLTNPHNTAGTRRPSRSRRASEACDQEEHLPKESNFANECDVKHRRLDSSASRADGSQGRERSKRARRSTAYPD